MQEGTLILTYAGIGLAVMMLGMTVFLQGTILEHPEEQKTLGQRVRNTGSLLFAIGLAYVAGCLTIAIL